MSDQKTYVKHFESRIMYVGDCIIWTGTLTSQGYGVFKPHYKERAIAAHRYSYELANGKIPDGLELDHLCRNPACVNPVHLEAVTHTENVRRGSRLIVQCPKGHPYDSANTTVVSTPTGSERRCKTCRRDGMRALRASRTITRDGKLVVQRRKA